MNNRLRIHEWRDPVCVEFNAIAEAGRLGVLASPGYAGRTGFESEGPRLWALARPLVNAAHGSWPRITADSATMP